MSYNSFENYIFFPAHGENKIDLLYALEAATEDLEKNVVVVIPYHNPALEKIKPEFFKIGAAINVNLHPDLVKPHNPEPVQMTALTSKEVYIKKVLQLKQEIQRGNIYEINYCIQFSAENVTIDPFRTFLKLNTLAKAPYSSLLKLGDEFILCVSPELFLQKKGKELITKPIKGTIGRGKTPAEDDALKSHLENSLKERTENVMAVDVARNDLSVIAEKASVKVNKLYNIETFETVHQMVSTVSCEIAESMPFSKIIDATFPMASMTGAPKIRAMQLIDEFEDFERGYYSGTVGLIDEKGDFTFSVIIRSIFYNQKTKKISICVGGAITYLSDPEQEYEECLLKAKVLLKVLNARIE